MYKDEEIINYLDGSMPEDEQKVFEQHLNADSDLQKKIRTLKLINKVLDVENEEQLSGLFTKEYEKILRTKKRKRLIYYPVAAIIISLIAFYLILNYTGKQSAKELFYAYYYPYEINIETRNDSESNNNLTKAITAYNRKDYQNAMNHLKNISDEKSQQISDFLIAQIYLAQNKCKAAIEHFNLCNLDLKTSLDPHTQWYLALSHLKCNNTAKAKSFFSSIAKENNLYSEKAKEILRKFPE